MSARDYQVKAIDGIRDKYLQGCMKVLLWLATGGGKTFIFCSIIKSAFKKNKHIIVVVRGRKLVDQASERLMRENVPHGVYMANHWNYRPTLPVQVCSIDTLIARNIRPKADLIIIDEAHQSTSDGYKKFLSSPEYKNTRVLAVTATPYPERGSLNHVADDYIQPIRMIELVEQGYLVPFRYFAGESANLENVEISRSTGDYIPEQLADAMVSCQLDGKIVENWLRVASDRPTLCFAPTIKYSKQLVERFIKSGISSEHCDANTPDDERLAILKRSESGETQVISNVGIWGTGIDIPWISCITLARSTESYNLFIQQCGRGTRPFFAKGFDLSTIDGRLNSIQASVKKDCILLDHARNLKKHEYPTDEPPIYLDGTQKVKIIKKSKECEECGAIYRGMICHECGHKRTPKQEREAEILESEEILKEIKDIEIDPIKRVFKNYKKEQKESSKKNNWASHRLVERYGFDVAKAYLTEAFVKSYSNNIFKNSPYGR